MDQETVKNSKIAYSILRAFHKSEEERGLYSKEVEERVEASEDSVKKYIKQLRDLGLIKRTERTRRQYYNIDISGIYDFWTQDLLKQARDQVEGEHFEETIEEFEESLESDVEISEIEIDIDEEPKAGEDFGDISTLVYRYVPKYLNEVDKSTINQMLYQDLKLGFDRLSGHLEPGDILYKTSFPRKIGLLMEILGWVQKGETHELPAISVLRQELMAKHYEEELPVSDRDEYDEEEVRESIRQSQEKFENLKDSIEGLYLEEDVSEEGILDTVQKTIKEVRENN